MSKHWTITYAILIREASPVPFPFHGGCKFDEGARGGPCFARAANAARVAEGKTPRACTGDAHPGCFHRQGRAFFLAWALNWYLCQKAAHDVAFADALPARRVHRRARSPRQPRSVHGPRDVARGVGHDARHRPE